MLGRSKGLFFDITTELAGWLAMYNQLCDVSRHCSLRAQLHIPWWQATWLCAALAITSKSHK